MNQIIALIILGIWGSIILTGMILIKIEKIRATFWTIMNSECEFEEESEENE